MNKGLGSTAITQMQAMKPLVLGGNKRSDTTTKGFLSQGNPMADSHQIKNKKSSFLVEVNLNMYIAWSKLFFYNNKRKI